MVDLDVDLDVAKGGRSPSGKGCAPAPRFSAPASPPAPPCATNGDGGGGL